MDNLNAAMEAIMETVKSTPNDHPDRAMYLDYLGVLLQHRFERTGSMDDLNAAVEASQEAVKSAPQDNPHRLLYLNNLIGALHRRFVRMGSMDDLNAAVKANEETVKSTPHDHTARAGRLNNLGIVLRRRFERTGSMDDLNGAVQANEKAVKSTPHDHPHRAGRLHTLGIVLRRRFERTGSMDDLNGAVEANKEAVKSTPHDHPNRAGRLTTLGNSLQSRFKRTGSMDDLNAAVETIQEAVKLTPYDNPGRAMYLNNLGLALRDRYDRTGLMDDLNVAVDSNEEAVKSTPQDHPDRAGYLNNLGNALESRFERTGSMDDLNAAVEAIGEAVKLTPHDNPNRARRLSNLGCALLIRSERTGSMDDLNSAAETIQEAVTSTPHDHPSRSMYLNNLSSALQSRFVRIESMDDLNAVMEANEETVKSTPHDHPNRAAYLNNLGRGLQLRFERMGSMDDLNSAVNAYDQSVGSHHSPPNIRILSAIQGANLIHSKNPKRGSRLLTTAVELLPTTSPRTLHRNDQQFTLSQFDGLASDAAALSIRAGENVFQALRLLELGRGVTASLYFETRSDITELEKAEPELAEKFKLLRDKLDDSLGQISLSDAQRTVQSQIVRRYETLKEFDETIRLIQSKDGFKNFLLGPSGDELKRVASAGPIIIINASRFGSDSFIINHVDITHLPLPKLTYMDLEKNVKLLMETLENDNAMNRKHTNNSLSQILEWLWDFAVEPILKELGFTETPRNDEEWPHVWWIPVGRLGLFPIHAAGYHSINGRQTALDRVISSYTPTVRTLDHARDQFERLSNIRSHSVLLANMPTTPDKTPLPFAELEINAINNLLPRSMERVILQYPTKPELIEELKHCSVAHFACHGEVNDSDPSKSRILLADWKMNPFLVADMADIKLDQVQLAYLSACHAANNRNLLLLDESIHMAGACQLAGFPTVIGTLWQVPDDLSAIVAESLYRSMLTPEGNLDIQRAARGLHFALRQVREKSRYKRRLKIFDDLMAWAPYIHVGV